MYAIVTAGGVIEPNQPLYKLAHGGLKSMISIANKPMVQWVLDALGNAATVKHVVVVGLPRMSDLECRVPLTLLPDQGGMFANIRAGAAEVKQLDPEASHAILSTADIPAIRGEIIDWLAQQCDSFDQDVYFTLVERTVMEAKFPGVKLPFMHLKELEVCPGHLHCFRLQAALDDTPLWKGLVDSRKSSLRQASLLGYDAMLFLMLRRLSLKDAEAAVCKRLGVLGKAVLCPYPEAGLDVDKPAQYEIMRQLFAE